MTYWLKHWRLYFTPAPSTFYWLSGAGGVLGLGLALGLLYSQTQVPTATLSDRVQNFMFVAGFLASPLAILFCLIAAWFEPTRLVRATLWLGTALLVLLGGGLTALGLGLAIGLGSALAGWLLFCAPAALALSMPAIYQTRRASPEVQAAIAHAQEDRAQQMIEAQGEVTLSQLSQALALSTEACGALIERLLQSEKLFGLYDAARGRVYSSATLQERRHKLQAVVLARGQIHFNDLAQELHAPRELVRDWVYQSVQRGEFTGYINWEEGILYSAEAQKLAQAGQCPHCGGA